MKPVYIVKFQDGQNYTQTAVSDQKKKRKTLLFCCFCHLSLHLVTAAYMGQIF